MWQQFLYDFITYVIFSYSVIQLVFYISIGIFAIGAANKYANKNSFVDYKLLAVSPYAPSISILAPAYNEGANIIENVRSLLSIYYNNLEVLIINDGSKDNSLQQLIQAYNLEKVDFFVSYQIHTKPVRGVYKSKNPIYSKLVVIDKVNGGKADALNVGINIASNDYIVCIDVDCVLEQDALLKLMKPFLETTTEKVIATGGVVRIANSCQIQYGRLLKVNLPQQYLPKMQALEYIRAFLLGRMAWSRINGLMLISGAFGAFDKELAIKVGGYNHKTVGEDMELVVRMRRYMEELKQPYQVAFIPDPLCWTEAPANFKILGRQRNRWTRGTIETLGMHKKMFFNPKYHVLGMLSFPYWFFFEMCAPGVEFFGFIVFLVMALFHMIYWQMFFAFLVFIITFGYLFSAFAIFMEVKTYNQYGKGRELTKLLLAALSEPFVFHPFVVWSGVKGYYDKIRKKSSWGEMTRQGLNGSAQPAVSIPQPEPVVTEAEAIIEEVPAIESLQPVLTPVVEQAPNKKATILQKLTDATKEGAAYSITLTLFLLVIKGYELLKDVELHGVPDLVGKVIGYSLVHELTFALNIALLPTIIFAAIYLLNTKAARSFFVAFSVIFMVIHGALSQYFLETMVPLGGDLWNYSLADIKQTVGASGSVSSSLILPVVIVLSIVIWLNIYIPGKIKLNKALSFTLLALFGIAGVSSLASITDSLRPGQEFSDNLALNKSYFFYTNTYNHFFGSDAGIVAPDNANYKDQFTYTDEQHYPFLHTVDTTTDALTPFFNKSTVKPNFVFLVVEGLGRAFSNKNAYLGSFTPFLDSLSTKSLYWSNFVSAGGRTFAMLPSIFGSLPYGKSGFLEMGDKMPAHLSLLNILQRSGYKTNFFYGGDASFDNMSIFLKKNNTNIYDQKTYSAAYRKMPSIEGGFSWGYGDEELFKKYNEVNNTNTAPYCNVLLTLSTHNPFLINNQPQYIQFFEQRMQQLGFTEAQKQEHRHYQNQYSSIVYTDNAIRNFIQAYSTRPDFNNTIFVITGDHRMPEIPMSTKIDRYHVPLIIYSPLLKRAKEFGAMSSHLDITPSMLSFVGHQYGVSVPSQATWLGKGLDTATNFRNKGAFPLIQTKNDVKDYAMDNYFLNDNDLYKISNNMDLEPVQNDTEKKKLQAALARFKQKSKKLVDGDPLLPPELLKKK